MYTGRTQGGRVFACLARYFDGMPEGTLFSLKTVIPNLLTMYQYHFQNPERPVNESTGLIDGIRTIVCLENGPIEKVGRGRYKLIRKFTKEDGKWFYRHHYKFFSKGRRYREYKDKERMRGKGEHV